jgi:hypothetical protein
MDRIYVFGFNEMPLLGDGWYDPERLEGGPAFRATAPRARLVLREWGVDEVILICSARPTFTGEPLRAALVDPWQRTTPVVISSDAWHMRRYVPPCRGEVVGHLDIVVENPWSPRQVFGSADRRVLGLLVWAVRLSIRSGDHERSSGLA